MIRLPPITYTGLVSNTDSSRKREMEVDRVVTLLMEALHVYTPSLDVLKLLQRGDRR